MNCCWTVDMHNHWAPILMSAKKSSPEMWISEGCEFVGDNLMPPLEGITWQCSSCIFLDRHCAILLQEECFSGNNLDIRGNFHISLCRLKSLFFASFTRVEISLLLQCPTLATSWERKGFKECEIILWIKAGKRHLFFFLLLPFYHSTCCQSVRKLIYPSSNLSRWWVTKLWETLVEGRWRNKILYHIMYIFIPDSSMGKIKIMTQESHSKTHTVGLSIIVGVIIGF